jgi:hypothetical protein
MEISGCPYGDIFSSLQLAFEWQKLHSGEFAPYLYEDLGIVAF